MIPREEREEFSEIQLALMRYFLLPLHSDLAPEQPKTGHSEEPAEENCNCNRMKCWASSIPSCSILLSSHGLQVDNFCLVLHLDVLIIRGVLLAA